MFGASEARDWRIERQRAFARVSQAGRMARARHLREI